MTWRSRLRGDAGPIIRLRFLQGFGRRRRATEHLSGGPHGTTEQTLVVQDEHAPPLGVRPDPGRRPLRALRSMPQGAAGRHQPRHQCGYGDRRRDDGQRRRLADPQSSVAIRPLHDLRTRVGSPRPAPPATRRGHCRAAFAETTSQARGIQLGAGTPLPVRSSSTTYCVPKRARERWAWPMRGASGPESCRAAAPPATMQRARRGRLAMVVAVRRNGAVT